MPTYTIDNDYMKTEWFTPNGKGFTDEDIKLFTFGQILKYNGIILPYKSGNRWKTPVRSEFAHMMDDIVEKVKARVSSSRVLLESVYRDIRYNKDLDARYTALGEPNRVSDDSPHLRGVATDIGMAGTANNTDIVYREAMFYLLKYGFESGINRIGLQRTKFHMDIDDQVEPKKGIACSHIIWLYSEVKTTEGGFDYGPALDRGGDDAAVVDYQLVEARTSNSYDVLELRAQRAVQNIIKKMKSILAAVPDGYTIKFISGTNVWDKDIDKDKLFLYAIGNEFAIKLPNKSNTIPWVDNESLERDDGFKSWASNRFRYAIAKAATQVNSVKSIGFADNCITFSVDPDVSTSYYLMTQNSGQESLSNVMGASHFGYTTMGASAANSYLVALPTISSAPLYSAVQAYLSTPVDESDSSKGTIQDELIFLAQNTGVPIFIPITLGIMHGGIVNSPQAKSYTELTKNYWSLLIPASTEGTGTTVAKDFIQIYNDVINGGSVSQFRNYVNIYANNTVSWGEHVKQGQTYSGIEGSADYGAWLNKTKPSVDISNTIIKICSEKNIEPEIIFAIADGESHFNPSADNYQYALNKPLNSNGTIDVGMMQINAANTPRTGIETHACRTCEGASVAHPEFDLSEGNSNSGYWIYDVKYSVRYAIKELISLALKTWSTSGTVRKNWNNNKIRFVMAHYAFPGAATKFTESALYKNYPVVRRIVDGKCNYYNYWKMYRRAYAFETKAVALAYTVGAFASHLSGRRGAPVQKEMKERGLELIQLRTIVTAEPRPPRSVRTPALNNIEDAAIATAAMLITYNVRSGEDMSDSFDARFATVAEAAGSAGYDISTISSNLLALYDLGHFSRVCL